MTVLTGANAADGQIDFDGHIKANTCKINDDKPNFTVDLPHVSMNAFSQASPTTGRTPFQLNLTECTPETGSVYTYFEPGPTVNPLTGRLIVDAGGAQNVEVGLLNDRHGPIDASKAAGSQNSQLVAVSGGNATLDYFAEYAATGAVTPGLVKTRVQYTLIFP
ncbi:MAG: fimbrial protein [Pseudomonas sp.]|nr:fimbrial protein [Pseudomonas sp.]